MISGAARGRRPRRGRRLVVAGAAAALAVTGAVVWSTSTGTTPSVPVPLSLVQRDDLGDRVLLVARELQDPSPTPSPQERATDLAPRAGLRDGAVADVAAYAQQTADERSALAEAGTVVTGTTVRLDGMTATRQLGGPLLVCARVYASRDVHGGPPWEEVTPWVLTVDPGSQQITDVEVRAWDGSGRAC